jgi:toxin YhaV
LAVERARSQGAEGFESNANVKLFNALADLIFERVPTDPNRTEYRQGNTLGLAPGLHFRHWRRAKIGRRFRLFFRFDSRSQIIIYAWVNDAQALRASNSLNGRREDPVCRQFGLEPGEFSRRPDPRAGAGGL